MGNDPFLESLRKKGAETNVQFIEQAEALAQKVGASAGDLRAVLVPIHTLKGDLGALGYVSGQKLVHEYESIVIALDEARDTEKEKWKNAQSSFFDTVHFCLQDGLSVIRRYLDSIAEGQDEDPQSFETRTGEFSLCRGLLDEFKNIGTEPAPSNQVPIQQTQPTQATQPTPAPKKAGPTIDELAAAAQHKDFFLLCSLDGVDYALPVSHVREVIKQREVQDLPVARPDLVGLITLRGETLPVCNVTHHLAAETEQNLPLMVICQIEDRKLAIPMQRADKVLEIERSRFRPLQNGSGQDTNGPIRHILPEKDRVVLLVDVERLVAA